MEIPQEFRCKIIYSDIDGTLLNSMHHVPVNTRKKILELDRRGIPFIMVSARMPDGVEVIRKELGNRRPVICYSGGLVLNEAGNVIYSRQMKLALAMEIQEALKEFFPNICCNTYGGNLWVVEENKNPWVLREERIVKGKSVAGEIGKLFEKEGGVHKFLLMGESEDIRKTENFLKNSYQGLSISKSNDNYLEIMDGKVDKAEGVRILCRHYGISPEEAAAFGDGENDVGMLKAVKYGFAMENASEYVKKQVDFVTLSNDEEGMLEVLNRIL